MNFLGGSIKQIDSETLPAAAALANGVISNAAHLLDGMLTNAEACVADAITQTDAMLDRKLETLSALLEPVRAILENGLHLTGTIGGAPVDLVLKVNEKEVKA